MHKCRLNSENNVLRKKGNYSFKIHTYVFNAGVTNWCIDRHEQECTMPIHVYVRCTLKEHTW